MLPEASHFFAIGVRLCCALPTSCVGGLKRLCSILHLNSHPKVDRITILDGLYAEMLSILTAQAPSQRRRHRRRRQPAWWNADCFAACVARNGALRDHHRVRSGGSYMRFSAARQQLYGTVRAARRNFWALWEDHVSSLSAYNPRVAASTIRRTFQCHTDSSQVEHVQWPDLPVPPPRHDSVALWRGHFMSVGGHSEGRSMRRSSKRWAASLS